MTNAFQNNAFQNDAFQELTITGTMKHLTECLENLTVGAMSNVLFPVLTACVKDGILTGQLTKELIESLTKKGKKK